MTSLETILLSLATALVGSSLSGVIYNYYTKRRDERRTLYSKGLVFISEREELYYMILRRPKDNQTRDGELIRLMHDNQTKISNHQAVLEVDSYWMGASYRHAANDFRRYTEQMFRDAWKEPLNTPSDPVPEARRIDTSKISQKHARDCRRRLNPIRSAWNSAIRWMKR